MWVILDDINPAVGHRKNFRNAEQDSLKYILEYLYYWIHLKKIRWSSGIRISPITSNKTTGLYAVFILRKESHEAIFAVSTFLRQENVLIKHWN